MPAEQHLGHEAVLERVGRAPLAGDHGVVAEVPPEVVGQLLRPAVDLPAAEHVEALVVDQEDAARRLALGVAERADVDALGPAMDGVRPAVAGLARRSPRARSPGRSWGSSGRAWCRGCGCARSAGPARRGSAARHAGAARSGTGRSCRRSSRNGAARRRCWASSTWPTIWRVGRRGGVDVDHRRSRRACCRLGSKAAT